MDKALTQDEIIDEIKRLLISEKKDEKFVLSVACQIGRQLLLLKGKTNCFTDLCKAHFKHWNHKKQAYIPYGTNWRANRMAIADGWDHIESAIEDNSLPEKCLGNIDAAADWVRDNFLAVTRKAIRDTRKANRETDEIKNLRSALEMAKAELMKERMRNQNGFFVN